MLDGNWGGIIYIIFSIGYFVFGFVFIYYIRELISVLEQIKNLL